MSSTLQGDSLLLAQFRDFYSEVIRLKRLINKGLWQTPEPEGEEDDDGNSGTRSIHSVWKSLLNILKRQEANASRLSRDYMFDVYKESQFIMAALADDIFLHLNWSGKAIWEENLLEAKLFNTHSAGDSFFEKLDRLLNNQDTQNIELAKIYLMALSLGFEGKYRGREGEELNTYRGKLFNFIKQRDAQMGKDSYRLFDQAYGYTLDQGKIKRLPHPKGWIAALVLLVTVLAFVSHGLWLHTTTDLKFILHQILSIK